MKALPKDELFLLERRIARRADELARTSEPKENALELWQRAEREIFGASKLGVVQPVLR